MRKVIVYTDGSTLGNGQSNSACGWACKLIYGPWYRMKSGGDFGKTNNVMEDATLNMNISKGIN